MSSPSGRWLPARFARSHRLQHSWIRPLVRNSQNFSSSNPCLPAIPASRRHGAAPSRSDPRLAIARRSGSASPPVDGRSAPAVARQAALNWHHHRAWPVAGQQAGVLAIRCTLLKAVAAIPSLGHEKTSGVPACPVFWVDAGTRWDEVEQPVLTINSVSRTSWLNLEARLPVGRLVFDEVFRRQLTSWRAPFRHQFSSELIAGLRHRYRPGAPSALPLRADRDLLDATVWSSSGRDPALQPSLRISSPAS